MPSMPPAVDTVLLIEDEQDVRDLLRLNLKKAGFRVPAAAPAAAPARRTGDTRQEAFA